MPGGVRRQTQIEQPQDYYPQWSTETTKKERAKQ
jgi:hypothetical protein